MKQINLEVLFLKLCFVYLHRSRTRKAEKSKRRTLRVWNSRISLEIYPSALSSDLDEIKVLYFMSQTCSIVPWSHLSLSILPYSHLIFQLRQSKLKDKVKLSKKTLCDLKKGAYRKYSMKSFPWKTILRDLNHSYFFLTCSSHVYSCCTCSNFHRQFLPLG